ncbi:hypothetical protein MKW92_008483, partial [Papaver armeniacum]
DNNVKLIVHGRLNEPKTSHREIIVDMIRDVLRALTSPNLDIRRKTIDISLELITPRNIDEVVQALKKEVVKTRRAPSLKRMKNTVKCLYKLFILVP